MLEDFLITFMDFSIPPSQYGSYRAFSGQSNQENNLSKIYLANKYFQYCQCRYANHRECDERVQKLGCTILVLLCLEVVLHFLYFVYQLFKSLRNVGNPVEESLEMNTIIVNENEGPSHAPEINQLSDIESKDSRRNISHGMVSF